MQTKYIELDKTSNSNYLGLAQHNKDTTDTITIGKRDNEFLLTFNRFNRNKPINNTSILLNKTFLSHLKHWLIQQKDL